MNELDYLRQVEEGLSGHGFAEVTSPEPLTARLAFVVERKESWGRLFLAVATMAEAESGDRRTTLAADTAAWVQSTHEEAQERCFLLLVFPFANQVPDAVTDEIRALRQDGADERWGLIPWTADLEVELVDRPTGFPRVGEEVARTLTAVPRGKVEEVWRKASGPKIGARSAIFGNLGYVPATRAILALTIAYYAAAMLTSPGGLFGAVTGQMLLSWGGIHGALVLGEGQHWRLLTYLLLHGGLLHLGFNMWALWNVGRYVEMLFGTKRMLFIYLFSGVVAGMASTMLRPVPNWSVGASGAVLGLLGALVYFARAMPGRHVDLRQLMTVVVINLAYGFFIPIIDNYAHLGGFAGGFLAAWAVGVAGERTPWRTYAMAAGSFFLIVILSGLVSLPHITLFR
jgi:rhomboid protease GluP